MKAGVPFVVALGFMGCSFKPVHERTSALFFEIGYERPTAGHVDITYRALKEHDLVKLCVSLLKHKGGTLLGRNSGWGKATPEQCFETPAHTLKVGDIRTFTYVVPRTDVLFDRRKDMGKVGFDIVVEVGTRPDSWDFTLDL